MDHICDICIYFTLSLFPLPFFPSLLNYLLELFEFVVCDFFFFLILFYNFLIEVSYLVWTVRPVLKTNGVTAAIWKRLLEKSTNHCMPYDNIQLRWPHGSPLTTCCNPSDLSGTFRLHHSPFPFPFTLYPGLFYHCAFKTSLLTLRRPQIVSRTPLLCSDLYDLMHVSGLRTNPSQRKCNN